MTTQTDLSELRISRDAPARRQGTGRGLRTAGYILVALLLMGAVAVLTMRTRPIAVQTVRAEARGGGTGASASGLTANGYVVARTKASISSKLPGRLARLGAQEGDRVHAGDIIAWLESAEYEAGVQQAQANVLNAQAARIDAGAALEQAKRNVARAKTLAKDNLTSAQAVQDAETTVQSAEAQVSAADARTGAAQAALAGARANLENTRIRAPFDGTVLRKDAEVGEVVAPAVAGGGLTRGAVVTMADLATLEVEVDVNEAYIAEITQSQPAQIILDAYPAQTFNGHVRQILPTADRQKATVLVRVAIDSKDARILPEMGARVVFMEKPNKASQQATAQPRPARVFVPGGAVQNIGGKDVVWVVSNDKVEQRSVEPGPVSGSEREIRSGLSGGEVLVIDAPPGLRSGASVVVKPKS